MKVASYKTVSLSEERKKVKSLAKEIDSPKIQKLSRGIVPASIE